MIVFSRTIPLVSDDRMHTSIYNADNAILLLTFSQGIVDKRAVFVLVSGIVVKAGKEFLNRVVGEEGQTTLCQRPL